MNLIEAFTELYARDLANIMKLQDEIAVERVVIPTIKCECGAHKVKSANHSFWCAMYNKENK